MNQWNINKKSQSLIIARFMLALSVEFEILCFICINILYIVLQVGPWYL